MSSWRRSITSPTLLIVEALQAGLFTGLDAPSLAALLSCATYEAPPTRTPLPNPAGRPSSYDAAGARFHALAEELTELEKRATGSVLTRLPDPGFANLAYRWADGAQLESILDDEIPPGDLRQAHQAPD